ncbi:MAG: hypothetical protein RLN69_05420 [Woeseiaceae bacterium]
MRTIRKLTVLASLVCLGLSSATAVAEAGDCVKKRPKLKIDFHTLDFSEKKPICVKSNGVFTIKLKPLGDYVIVPSKISVAHKHIPDVIEKSVVTSNNILRVRVGSLPDDSLHEFLIKVDGVGVLDPRVRINNNLALLSPEQLDMNDFAQDMFGVGLLELEDLNEYFMEEYDTSIADILMSFRDGAD